jgi:protein-tyrosine phosphatase
VSVAPFTVLHVCMGNICRSPMAERLLSLAVAEASGVAGPELLVHSHSAGTGDWHAGQPMHPSAAGQVRARGGEPAGFVARQLRRELLDRADLVLVATADQHRHVTGMRPDAAERTFVLGELGRLLPLVDLGRLPGADRSPVGVRVRGMALVTAVDAVRDGAVARPGDDLADPYGRGTPAFSQVADRIERTVRPLAVALLAAG